MELNWVTLDEALGLLERQVQGERHELPGGHVINGHHLSGSCEAPLFGIPVVVE